MVRAAGGREVRNKEKKKWTIIPARKGGEKRRNGRKREKKRKRAQKILQYQAMEIWKVKKRK